MINKILSVILINSLIIYIIAKYIPQLGFSVELGASPMYLEIFFILGVIFWITNDLIRYAIKIMAFPLNFLTLGLFSVIINIACLYLFMIIANSLSLGFTITLGSVIQIVILSVVIAIFNLLFKKL